ncbi:MAG TPA: glycosyltransferase [Alphaproteobacteria bacterium]|nr:glycosyltransferase [Alphaproteobacteria bacterium]
MRRSFDIAAIGDFRFPGGTSTAVAAEIRAQAAAGYRTALLQLRAPLLRAPHPFHPEIRACLDAGLAELADPDQPLEAALVQLHHPLAFAELPERPLRLRGEKARLIVHHPPRDGAGRPAYDAAGIHRHACEILGAAPLWAPVGPLVRAAFAGLEAAPPLAEADWPPVIDPGDWAAPPRRPGAGRPVLGRHSRPDPLKWPATQEAALAALPDDPDWPVRILGGGPFLAELLEGPPPANWQVLPFGAVPARDFLAGLDAFVYFHHPDWLEAFGRTVLEALASGVPAILPETLRPTFGDAALYAEPTGVRGLVERLWADPAAYAAQVDLGRARLRERWGPEAHAERLRRLIGPPRGRSVVPGPRPPPRRAMLVSSNGIGMGHLTRTLAIARRLPPPVEPVIVTMSQAVGVAHEFGLLAEHIPFHRHLDCDVAAWNRHLAAELDEMIRFYDPAAVLFDGNQPYSGLVAARREHPHRLFLWCRRGLWRADANDSALAAEAAFDAVIEPRELAGALDRGPTARHRGRVRPVDPIVLLDAGEMLPRAAARAALDLPAEGTAVLLQLGSGNNFDTGPLRRAIVDRLLAAGATVAVAQWLIADEVAALPPAVRRLEAYPLARWLPAFDFAVAAAGYNAFHELMLAGVPAIHVPNEAPMMDDQGARARWAEMAGCGLRLRAGDIYAAGRAVDALLDPARRAAMAAACAARAFPNGAVEAARFLGEHAMTRRADLGFALTAG